MNLKRFLIPRRAILTAFLILLGVTGLVFITLWATSQKVQALPEYSTRTGESCAACHVSAGGGGPRTLRGMLWSARGKPDKVPSLPGMLIAPHVDDPAELYQIACGGCHGYKGEGLSARGLANTRISLTSIRTFTVDGITGLGMPAFKGQFTGAQLEKLLAYVAGLSSGKIAPPVDTYLLPPAQFRCATGAVDPACGALNPTTGGN